MNLSFGLGHFNNECIGVHWNPILDVFHIHKRVNESLLHPAFGRAFIAGPYFGVNAVNQHAQLSLNMFFQVFFIRI